MKKNKSALALSFLAAAVVCVNSGGCAIAQIADTPSAEELAKVEKSRQFTGDHNLVWSATIKSLMAQGMSIQSQDKTSGSISTDWVLEKEAVGIFTTGSRFRMNILVEKSGASTQVTIMPAFEIRVADKANWQPTQRKRDHIGLETQFFDQIQKNM